MRNGFRGVVAGLFLSSGTAWAAPADLPEPADPTSPALIAVSYQSPESIASPPAVTSAPIVMSDAPMVTVMPDATLRVRAEGLAWWTKNGPSPTLLTNGSPTDLQPGAIGSAGTSALYGQNGFNTGVSAGFRITADLALTDTIALEGSYLQLEKAGTSFSASSDETGRLLIARPVFNVRTGLEDSYGTSFPDSWSGRTTISNSTRLQGFELNLTGTGETIGALPVKWLAGYRYLDLQESLQIDDALTPLGANILSFNAAPIAPPQSLSDFDRFRTTNHFHGGQVGLRTGWAMGKFSLTTTAKVALGVTEQTATIEGTSTLNTPGSPSVTVPGGILAQTTNIGKYSRDVFSVVPEVQVGLGYQVTQRLRADIGYNFLYWSNVARPGNQIDHNIQPGIVPTGQDFGTQGGPANAPGFQFKSSGFWTQGINFGLTFTF